MKKKNQRKTLMQLEVSLPLRILFSVLIMAALIAFVYFCNIPNPNMILIAGLVFCSAVFGFGGGITAGMIMFIYTLFFFSTDHSFIHFTTTNIQKVIVSFIGIVADLLLVCVLKRSEVKAFREVDQLTEKLHQENELLFTISKQDALTGILNRTALRQDYELYTDRRVTVMMMDLDRFKTINDSNGHETGDRILRETGDLLLKTFGREHCYRYGGDEFLVVCPDISEEEFRSKLDLLRDGRPSIEIDGKSVRIDFSIGYVHGYVKDPQDLRKMFSSADKLMYRAKRAKMLK